MKIKLVRESFTNKATEGVLYIDDKFECYTLEDTDRDLENGGIKVDGKTAIPKGIYGIVVDMSTRFKREMPRLLSVEGFTGIRIHSGNYANKETFLKNAAILDGKELFKSEEMVTVY